MANRGEDIEPGLTLANHDLWAEFRPLPNEMVLTRGGRKMFPTIETTITNLQPKNLYSIYLEFRQIGATKHRYSHRTWSKGTVADPPPVSPYYKHPDSPNFGAYWMQKNVSFATVKLSNQFQTAKCIQLNSLHSYRTIVHIVRCSGSEPDQFDPDARPDLTRSFPLDITRFITVTAYQNMGLTELKVERNPQARSFRDNTENQRPIQNGSVIRRPNGPLVNPQVDNVPIPTSAQSTVPLSTIRLSQPTNGYQFHNHASQPAPSTSAASSTPFAVAQSLNPSSAQVHRGYIRQDNSSPSISTSTPTSFVLAQSLDPGSDPPQRGYFRQDNSRPSIPTLTPTSFALAQSLNPSSDPAQRSYIQQPRTQYRYQVPTSTVNGNEYGYNGQASGYPSGYPSIRVSTVTVSQPQACLNNNYQSCDGQSAQASFTSTGEGQKAHLELRAEVSQELVVHGHNPQLLQGLSSQGNRTWAFGTHEEMTSHLTQLSAKGIDLLMGRVQQDLDSQGLWFQS